ncbi:MAG: hypothetical protein MI746_01870 [Pseudomonadales bacterium]|nr:hypothetical protein [Pseudomonadales bacterium]
MKQIALQIVVLVTLTACAVSDSETPQVRRVPTDAEVEAYNARVAPEERIVCRREVPVGSHIPKRVCRLQAQMEDESTLQRSELRRVLQ